VDRHLFRWARPAKQLAYAFPRISLIKTAHFQENRGNAVKRWRMPLVVPEAGDSYLSRKVQNEYNCPLEVEARRMIG
jgi:hypothetical protein